MGGGQAAWVSFPVLIRSVYKVYTLIKKKIKFSWGIQNGAVAKSYMTNGLLIYGKIFAHFLIYEDLGSPSSYMTLQLLHSEFPYIGKFDFLFYQCTCILHL